MISWLYLSDYLDLSTARGGVGPHRGWVTSIWAMQTFVFFPFFLDVKSRHILENKNFTLPRFGGTGFAPEVCYILVFLLLFFLQKWYILIPNLIYFKLPFWHSFVAFYLQFDVYWSFYRSSFCFCTLLQLISTNKYWHLTTKLDIELRGLLHNVQKGKRMDDFKSFLQRAKKRGYIFHLLSHTCFTFLPSFNRL